MKKLLVIAACALFSFGQVSAQEDLDAFFEAAEQKIAYHMDQATSSIQGFDFLAWELPTTGLKSLNPTQIQIIDNFLANYAGETTQVFEIYRLVREKY